MAARSDAPARGGVVAVAAGVAVAAAMLAAPQFALRPAVFGASVLVGAPVGAAAALLGRRYEPSRGFVAAAVPLVLLAVWRVLEVPGVTRPAVLVALAALALAGTVTNVLATSR